MPLISVRVVSLSLLWLCTDLRHEESVRAGEEMQTFFLKFEFRSCPPPLYSGTYKNSCKLNKLNFKVEFFKKNFGFFFWGGVYNHFFFVALWSITFWSFFLYARFFVWISAPIIKKFERHKRKSVLFVNVIFVYLRAGVSFLFVCFSRKRCKYKESCYKCMRFFFIFDRFVIFFFF